MCDTREQAPLSFKDDLLEKVEKVALPFGDYGAQYTDGTKPPIVFERKSLGDLFGTMGKGYPRFRKEMERAKEAGVALIIAVEAPLSKVYRGYKYSKMGGSSCVQKLFTLWMRYGIQTVYFTGRAEMASYILETYKAIGREWVLKGKPGMPGRGSGG